jgi:hypothetical protein
MSSLNSTLNVLTPPTTPDECEAPCDLELVTFGGVYQDIECRGRKTKEGIRVKVNDLIDTFKLNVSYMKTVARYLSVYSLRDLYRQDFYSITGVDTNSGDPTLFSEYAQSHELYITYKGIDILARNVPKMAPFREWLDSVMEVDLHCYEEIDYDRLGW